ncbi:enoyl-CoA hydratase/isomerase family protein [bacterium]|nr:enoyl-CoA hydratase/isomerase family protein [bacterium]
MGAVLLEERERVSVLVLDAEAKGNAVDRALLSALEARLREIEKRVLASDPAAPRALILRGAGERAFSTGYDIEELVRELSSGASVVDESSHPLERALRALDECPVPTIALVLGNAFGAGCEIACACDLRVASDDARFCMPPAKLGALYSASGTRRLLELVGLAATREMFFTGEPIAASRALALGLANRVLPRTDALAEASRMAEAIAKNAPLTVRNTKAVLRRLRPGPLDPATAAFVSQLREQCFRSRDFQEATRAFLEKRKPDFEGR